MRVAVCGPLNILDFRDMDFARLALRKLLYDLFPDAEFGVVVSNDGISTWVLEYCRERNLRCREFLPNDHTQVGIYLACSELVKWADAILLVFPEYPRYDGLIFFALNQALKLRKRIHVWSIETVNRVLCKFLVKLKPDYSVRSYTSFGTYGLDDGLR